MLKQFKSIFGVMTIQLLTTAAAYSQDTIFHPDKHWVCVSQTGYNIDAPKRFTAPTAMEATADFYITAAGSNMPLYKGKTVKGVGDFSGFRPADVSQSYVVHVKGGTLPEGVSYPFKVAPYLIEKEGLHPSVWFMNDTRSATGTHHSAYGGCPWRDGTYYSYEIPSLIWMYLSNPAVYDAMPATISYDSLKAIVMSPDYKLVKSPNDETALEATRKYFTTIEKPTGNHIPDVIMDLHWGVGYYMVNPETRDPSKDPLPRQLHPQTLAQLAFFLYAYPYLDKWFSHSFYENVLQFTRQHWTRVGLLDIQREIGTSKGRHAPGFSVLPNLLMYEVAKREQWPEAADYMKAATRQTTWMIDSLSLQDPMVTKGQRMSEHMLMSGIAMYQLQYEEQAPAGLRKKIAEWADIVISRSNNAWDFRRYDLDSNWTVPEFNEVGNVAGFPASALLAAAVIKDTPKKQRLEQIGFAHFDNLYGRNPLNVHAAHHPERGFSGISKGYPKGYQEDVCARLELSRGSISCLPGTEMYPFNPLGKDRHLEGWINHNTAWNMSLAVLSWYDNRPQSFEKKKDGLYISWQAPVTNSSTLPLTVYVNGVKRGKASAVAGKNNMTFTGKIGTSQQGLMLDSGVVPVSSGDRIAVGYGYGFLERQMELKW
ncbi:hypothetical protein [Chitinophaga filiformis]|uniref:Uncharacterized protein n=1 Tax=Chitinophaga filiformis TaxID=104663 RepID=A0A1G7P9F8_CHIFI|nr:hypothetical protein [Chitinophaga filiformis]SDF82918.1 hypothetical protein SAMN04488121_1021115 [Chitinophaga filiformis]